MAEADDAFEHARRAFRNAADAPTIQAIRHYVMLGLAYLKRAEDMSAVVDRSEPAKATRKVR